MRRRTLPHPIDPDIYRAKSIEVHSLVHYHEVTIDQALEIVSLDRQQLQPATKKLGYYIPMPEMIKAITTQIRSGELSCGERRGLRPQWRERMTLETVTREREAPGPADAFDTAGSLPEDAVVMPSWFRGE